MDPFSKDFDAFFNRMSGNSSSTLGTTTKSTRPSAILSAKGKFLDSSFGSSRGTSATCKRKLDYLFTVFKDLMEGKLDSVANMRISHLNDCFLHTSEYIFADMAAEVDILDMNEHYGRARKAFHNVSAFHSYPILFFLFLLFFYVTHFSLLFYFFYVGDLTLEHTHISQELEGLKAKHDGLLSCQNEMVDRAFTHIMTEVWGLDLELVVPRV